MLADLLNIPDWVYTLLFFGAIVVALFTGGEKGRHMRAWWASVFLAFGLTAGCIALIYLFTVR